MDRLQLPLKGKSGATEQRILTNVRPPPRKEATNHLWYKTESNVRETKINSRGSRWQGREYIGEAR